MVSYKQWRKEKIFSGLVIILLSLLSIIDSGNLNTIFGVLGVLIGGYFLVEAR